MAFDGRPLLGLSQPQLGLSDQLLLDPMTASRDNKTKRGRISHTTRAIFYENLQRGLRERVSGDTKADQIRFLMEHAHLSRTHAQRMVNGLEAVAPAQAPTIDTLAFIAAAFGSTASEFLTQNCKFAITISATDALGQDGLHRPSSRHAIRRRRT